MMGLILARMLALVFALIVGGFITLVMLAFGDKQEAMQSAIITAMFMWLIAPSAEDRADFAEFQKSRERFPS
jgi:ABC-type uncharacterized transport system involved in gliding motility auxiliary subunit